MSKKIVGMVHVRALPGTPRHSMSLAMIVTKAVEEAAVFVAHGFDAIIIENMHDTPYLMRKVGPEILACMTAVGCAIRARFPRLEIGVQILAGANREAIACAQAFDGSFVRCEGAPSICRHRKALVSARPTHMLISLCRLRVCLCCRRGHYGAPRLAALRVDAHPADVMRQAEAAAGELLRYRRNIGATHVKIFCDIKKKHSSHAITAGPSQHPPLLAHVS